MEFGGIVVFVFKVEVAKLFIGDGQLFIDGNGF
jgi:hypothetical protein